MAGVPAAFLTVGEALNMSATASPVASAATLAGTAMGGAATAAAVWWAAPHKWTGKDGKPRWSEVWYARLSALAAGAWLTAAARWGLDWWTLGLLGGGALAWGGPWWWHKRPRKQAATIVAEWARWWQHYAPIWGVAGCHIFDVTSQGVIDTLHIQLWAGHQHGKHIEDILPLIESALQGHVQVGMTRAETVKGDPSKVLVHLKRKNPHAVEYSWDPALAPDTVNGKMPIGKDERGAWDMVRCMALNWFIIGALGGGKSNELSVMLASITGCADARVWLIDRKGGKAARPWLPALDWVATTVEEARLMLRCLLAEVRARALDGYDGNEEMTPTPQVPAIFLVIDEAHNVTSEMNGDTECRNLVASIASECRSSAIRVIVCTQYGALAESVGTEQTRGNLKNRICFKVADPAHGQFALEDYMKLNAARLEEPGEFYYRLDGVQSSAPSRGPHLPHPLVRELAARNALVERPPLVLYAADHQETYGTRGERLPAQFRSPSAPPAIRPEETKPMWPTPGTATAETPEQIAQRIEDELATIPDVPSPTGPIDPALLADAVTRKKMLWAKLLHQAPPGGIKPSQLAAGSGLGRSWTQQQLAALLEMRVITRPETGRYVPVPGQDIWAGLERIRLQNDHAADQARRLVSAGNS